MANNRMFLVHRPTGIAVIISKHMGWGWYNPTDEETMQAFYELTVEKSENMAEMEDICLGMESCDADSPFVKTDLNLYHHYEPDNRFYQINKPNGK